jgi:alpha-beta hydrolase superfamily lysophospholipase
METISNNYIDLDDGRVQYYKWFPNESPKAIIIIVHGMAEHIERYNEFANYLANNGYLVVGYNQRGHKGSISSNDDYGYMGKFDNFKVLVSDLNKIVEIEKISHPKSKIFIFGHSMGSFVTQSFVQNFNVKVDGVILSGSARQNTITLYFGLFLAVFIKLFLGRRHRSKLLHFLTFGIYNKQFKPNRTASDWLSRDNDEVDKYINDNYCGGIFSTAYFKDFFKGLIKINRGHHKIYTSLPILLISGAVDPVGGSSKFVRSLFNSFNKESIKDLDLKIYPNARHELLNELNKEEVFEDCLTWLNSRL